MSPPPSHDGHTDLDAQVGAAMARAWGGLSPISLTLAYTDWLLHLLSSPGSQARLAQQAMAQAGEWVNDAVRSGAATAVPTEPTALGAAVAADARFADATWQQWPWHGLATASKAWEGWWNSASQLRGMQDHSREQMRFYGQQMLDAFSPSNWLATNPQALQAAWQSGGTSLLKGMGHAVDELRLRHGLEPLHSRAADPSPGHGLAMTPGRVVMRNALIELIQYQPTTARVQRTPLLIVPSCIMKFHILDLTPETSMVRWLVAQGHTVYILSWRNPDESDALLSMDDYVRDGVLAALGHVWTETGEPVHLCGYCLGGTFAAIAAAALGGAGNECLASLTLLAAETDFTEPGEMGVLIDEAQVRLLEDMMAARGFLTGQQMAGSFQFLHARELVWSSRTKRWLLGEDEVGNELMVWNADVTRLPAVMHSQYLRSCFLNNELAEGRFRFEDEPVALRDIRVPAFGVGTLKDHVAPWRSCYKMHRLVSGPVTFALTNGGHNAGIVSEPGHPGRYHQLLTSPPDQPWRTPEEWQAAAPRLEGSWWLSWHAWLLAQGRPGTVAARAVPARPGLPPAPGDHVLVRYGD
jgi:polyhydroxyalkanoate synthase subunit PhaC